MRNAVMMACLSLLSLSSGVRGDDADLKKSAQKQFDESQTALLKGEYDKFVATNHPKLVELMGGKEKMVETLDKETKKMKAEGFEFKSVVSGTPSEPIKAGNEIYLTVPGTLEIKVPGGKLKTDCTVIGVSSDAGKTWLFVNAVKDREDILKIVPQLPKELVLPKKMPPTFIKE